MIKSLSPASPGIFLGLVLAATVPFWIVGAFTDLTLVPGVPFAGLAVICPGAAAVILTGVHRGPRGLGHWLVESLRLPLRQAGWLVPTLVLVPGIMAASYALQSVLTPLPLPGFSWGRFGVLVALTVPAAWAEELGWSGYATGPLRSRFGVFPAALILGLVWALWHAVALVQAHRSWDWIAWWTLGTVANRFVITLLYTRTGDRVLLSTLYHAVINLTWQMFPGDGAFYDPAVTSPLSAVLALGLVGLFTLERTQEAKE